MKKGFTLIELLAVIVVLAVIALIAIPIITNVIESAKEGAFRSSVLNGYNSVEMTLLKNKQTEMPLSGLDVSSLNLKNNFKSGRYKKSDNKIIAYNITNGKYCANGDINNLIITKGNCGYIDGLPEDRMMDSYVSDELYELMIQYSEDPSNVSTEEVERVTNLLDGQMEQQYFYFFKEDMTTRDEDDNIVLPTVEKVTTLASKEVPANVIYSKDISYKKNGKVMVWFLDEDNDSELEMYIGQDGGVIAPRNTMFLFRGFGKEYDLSNFDTSYTTNMMGMFVECESLTSLNVSNFNTSKVTNMSWMFAWCENLTSLDLSNFNTSKVTDMSSMFWKCSNLTSLDVSAFDTSKVTNMSYMFNSCSSLTSLDVNNFNTSKVTDMSYMFNNCSSLTSLDVSNFDTSKVTNMSRMLAWCENLTSLDISNFDTSKVTNMSEMFEGCSSLTNLDLSNFNTSNVTDMSSMFWKCSNLTSLDLSSFNTSNVTDMSFMFNECLNLTTIYNGTKWVTASEADYMFANCGTSTLTLK